MADAVTTQVLQDGRDSIIVKLTNVSDGTGESAVKKVDASDYSASAFRIAKIDYATSGMAVQLLWDATTDVLAWTIPQDVTGHICFPAAITNNAGTGVTGDLLLTTVGHTAGDSYSIILHLTKIPA